MLFNSYEFIFVFLPITVVLFFVFGALSREWAIGWIITASLLFYAWWRPLNVLIIAPSIVINFFLARLLQRLRKQERPGAARAVLLLGLAFNVAFLGYFKYSNFFVDAVNDVSGSHLFLARIILPLGISFITFQKIAFLIDVHAGRVETFRLQDYCLFVLFFPQLIAGPIVHYREMMPQFHRVSCKFDKENVAMGVTLFAFGLFKKAFVADRLAPMVTPIYSQAAAGMSIAALPAWMAALGFTFQIYFDFSGYTDMALGIARFFGIKLPPNFNSPLRASSIIDFWLRWHMTLTRFLTAYIYNPLALALTRRRMERTGEAFTGHNKSVGAFLELLMFPTMLTMLISGIWHGAGYLFILWGLLHGLYLSINHAWRLTGAKLWRDKASYERLMQPAGFVITFLCVVASMVLFRSTNMKSMTAILQGMAGFHGLKGLSGMAPEVTLSSMAFWIFAAAFIAFLCPDTLQVLGRYEPALGWKPAPAQREAWITRIAWSPSLAWAVVVSIIATIGILHLGGQSEFLYWQF